MISPRAISPTMHEALIARRQPLLTRRRVILTAVSGLLLLGLLAWLGSIDDAPPDTSDLQPTRRQLPDDQNAFLVLARAVGLVKWGTDPKTGGATYFGQKVAEQDFEDLGFGPQVRDDLKSWDIAKVAPWLVPLEDVWPLLRTASSLPSAQVPVGFIISPVDENIGTGANSDPGPLHGLLTFSELRAWQLCHKGRTDEGIDWLLITLRAAQSLRESRGGVGLDLIGYKIRIALEADLVAMATLPEASTAAVRRAIVELAQTRYKGDEFAQNLRADFQLAPGDLEALHQGTHQLQYFGDREKSVLDDLTQWRLFFKPHQTLWWDAETLRSSFKLIDADWSQVEKWAAEERMRYSTPMTAGWRGFNPDNFFGRLVAQGYVGFPRNNLWRRFNELSRDSATEAVLALCLYHRDHGALPANLDQLVPAYLPAVPLDYIDHQPIRYSRDFFAVWSIWHNHFTVTSHGPDSDDIQGETDPRVVGVILTSTFWDPNAFFCRRRP